MINHLHEVNIYPKQARVNAEVADAVGNKVMMSASFKRGAIEKVDRGRVPVSERNEFLTTIRQKGTPKST